MDDQTEIKPDARVIDATGDTDILANAGEPDPNVVPAGPAATSFADAAASFGGLDVMKAPDEALPDEPAEAVEEEAEVAKEEIVASLEDDAIPVADDEGTPEPETLQTAETTGHDFNALMFRTAALNAAASICQGTGASAYEVTAKAEDLMVWLQGDASSADFEEPRD